MRIKALICAAVFAAGIVTTMAQVYSANVVGYVNYTMEPNYSYNFIGNPLNNKVSNNITNLFTAAQMTEGVQILRWDTANFDFSPTISVFSAGPPASWANDFVLNPGEGVFLVNPAETALTVTYVGEVVEGSVVTALAGNYSYNAISSTAPLGGNHQNAIIGLVPSEGDQILTWDIPSFDFSATIPVWSSGSSSWSVTVPLKVGEGFMYVNTSESVNNWTRTWSVPRP